jgi:acyl carrier protein
MVTVQEVADLARHELRRRLPKGIVLDESTRVEDIGLSSLQMSELVFTLEERHEFEFDPARAADIQTLGAVVALANEALGVRDDGVHAPHALASARTDKGEPRS